MTGPTLTLASTSVIRKTILRDAGVEAETLAPGVDEAMLKPALLSEGASPRDIADALAEAKAVKVSRKRLGLVIGADSTLELEGRLFDKPADLAEARDHLIALRGKTHSLHSAVVVAQGGAPLWRHVHTARLQMRAFSDSFLDRYLEHEGYAILSSVGGYRLEGPGAQLFQSIDGDYFAILGLPLLPLLDYLRMQDVIAA